MAVKINTNPNQSMRQATREQIVRIDWKLLMRRLRRRFQLLVNSAKYQAAQTEYTPPVWMSRFRLTWFRLGLIVLLIYVFTQKQIDFNISVGKDGLMAGQSVPTTSDQTTAASDAPESHTHRMSVLPTSHRPVNEPNSASFVDQLDEAAVRAYIDRFERVARTEADKFGIPAAGKLAMAIYESRGGTSPVSKENNNHFGAATPSGFYPNAWTNWRSHSEYLRAEYPQLTGTAHDLDGWLSALERSNYSSNPGYVADLRQIIERFSL